MFGTKSKGLFVDLAGDVALAARTTGLRAPFVIEELREIPLADPVEAAEALRSLAHVRGNGYAASRCAIYPPNRIVSRVSVDGRKLREEGYLAQHLTDTLKIDVAAHQLFVLSTVDGTDVIAGQGNPKDVIVCGAPTVELSTAQEQILDLGLFPETMEIGTVATLGAVMDLLRRSESKVSTLLLEIGSTDTQVFVTSRDGVEITRTVPFGVSSMIPVVQKELALKDEESARKLFFSNSFDFTSMGPQLTKRLLRELQASIGFYEVQTGQSITQLCCTLLPAKVGWLQATLSDVLGMKALELDFAGWLGAKGIRFSDSVETADLGPVWTGLFSLMSEFRANENEAAA
jgi:hypothetical protein